MKKIMLFALILTAMTGILSAQGLETFGNFTYTATAYVDGSFAGDNGVNWNYWHVTGSTAGTNINEIEGNGMILRRSDAPSRIISDPIPNGIGSFSVQMRKAYTSAGVRQVALYVNNVFVANSQEFGEATGADPTIHTFAVNDINVSGNVVIEIRHITGGAVNRQLTIDNIQWTAFGGGTPTTATPVFAPNPGFFSAPVSVSISCSTAGSSIFYTTDGSTPTPASTPYSAPFTISQTTTVKAIATAPAHNNSNIATGTYSFPVTVNSLSQLRTMPADGITVYVVASEVILTFKQVFRNQKYVQDAGAGVLIDDLNGVITTQYNVYDGITGLTGKISEFGGMLQFVPTVNSAAASSTNNTVTPVTVNYDQLINNFDTYESRLVKVIEVSFTAPTGSFANGIVYPSFDQDSDYNIRTTFYDVDYIGTPIPTTPKNITGIPNSRVDGAYFTPRWLSDFQDPAGSVAAPTFSFPSGVYYSPIVVSLSTATPGASIYFTLDSSNPSTSSQLYTAPISIVNTTTVKAIAFLAGFPPSSISMATYTYPLNVSSIAALRQSPTGTTLYRLTGDAVVTFAQSYRNQKFVQDSTAGILIDDLAGVIASPYVVGDAFMNLIGTLSEYGGMLQFVPTLNPGPPNSSGNVIAPQVITMQNFIDSFENYESELVTFDGVLFSDTGEIFANGIVYPITNLDGSLSINLRTTFYDVNYINTQMPNVPVRLTGIPNSRPDGNYFTPRNLDDFFLAEFLAPSFLSAEVFAQTHVMLTWGFTGTAPWGVSGFQIYRNNQLIHESNDSELRQYIDIPTPGSYIYFVKAAYFDGYYSPPSQTASVNTGTSNDDPGTPNLPTALIGNYTNPFNPSTTIAYTIKEAGKVRLDIYNSRGQLIRTLVNESRVAGAHSAIWNGSDHNGEPVSSGIYYYRMQSGSYSSTRKMLMLK
ncbi:MAG: chitobiase/beta-hexosaminidase C-terminal domain-containing protein [Candidatus Cloacimonadaceae bacterium]|nr:chitobiase/beta-hexosaminidase C-terminal domain-containing protein [Candidatus Cloacimonadaceae bacterium]